MSLIGIPVCLTAADSIVGLLMAAAITRQENQHQADHQKGNRHRALIHESQAVRQVYRAGEVVLQHAAEDEPDQQRSGGGKLQR